MKRFPILGLLALTLALAACGSTAASAAAAANDSQSSADVAPADTAADVAAKPDVPAAADVAPADAAADVAVPADVAVSPDVTAAPDVAAAPDAVSFSRSGKKYSMSMGIGATYVGATKIMVVSGTLLSPMMSITLTIEGTAAGTYSCKTGATSVTHVGPNAAGTNISFKAATATGDCSIVVSEYGAVGGKIAGTFTASVVGNGETVSLTDGTFNVTRKADQ